ncbi:MAG: MATE family efflux transporter, partial [Porcipelethomonas sp.]
VLYGEKDFFGVRSLSKNIIAFSYILLTVLLTLLFIFTRQAAALFGIQSEELMNMSVTALRIFIFCLPFYSFNRFMTVYFQTTEKTCISNLINILEYCGVLLPSVMIAVVAAKALGVNLLNAIMTAFVTSELITVLLVMIIVKLKYRKGLFILPENNSEEVLDISVSPELDEAVKVAQDIAEFCEGKLDKSHTNRIAVAAEEMTVNTIKHGDKYVKSIDIMLRLTDEFALVRFRDNGTPFDPTEYSYDSEDYKFGEIDVMLKLADKVTYMRMLDFNNTIIEIKR